MIIPSITSETISTQVIKKENQATVDPTSDTVYFAFVTVDTEPGASDWNSGTWQSTTTTYYAQIQVGGTGSGATVELAEGNYDVWIRVDSSTSSDDVRRKVDELKVT